MNRDSGTGAAIPRCLQRFVRPLDSDIKNLCVITATICDSLGQYDLNKLRSRSTLRTGRQLKTVRLSIAKLEWLATLLADILQECLVHRAAASKQLGHKCAKWPNVQSSGTDAERDAERNK